MQGIKTMQFKYMQQMTCSSKGPPHGASAEMDQPIKGYVQGKAYT
jgi:hypothetical protein